MLVTVAQEPVVWPCMTAVNTFNLVTSQFMVVTKVAAVGICLCSLEPVVEKLVIGTEARSLD